MKNPRGYLIQMFMFASMLLFVLGPIQGNPIHADKAPMVYSMNSPPGTIVTIDNATCTPEVVIQYVMSCQVARGVSVPIKEYIVSIPVPVERSKNPGMTYYYKNKTLTLQEPDNSSNQYSELYNGSDFSRIIQNLRAREKL